jgi:ribosomal protein L11 methyltransferase
MNAASLTAFEKRWASKAGTPVSSPDLIEVAFSNLDTATSSVVAEILDRWGWGGAVLEEVIDDRGGVRTTVKTFVAAADEERVLKIEIALALLNRARASDGLPAIPLPELRRLAETDWAEAWKAHYHVLHIGHRLVVKPTWEVYDSRPGEIVIEMDPGLAFGSGLHATTRLCLELLESHVQPGQRVLDVGTGSGILAVAAAKLGAAEVVGIDNDPEAVRVARDNVQLNELMATVAVQAGTLGLNGRIVSLTRRHDHGLGADLPPDLGEGRHREHPGKPRDDVPMQAAETLVPHQVEAHTNVRRWDIVLANIVAETIIEMAPALAASVAPAGQLIASGIIHDRVAAVTVRLHECGLHTVEQRQEGDWVAVRVTR